MTEGKSLWLRLWKVDSGVWMGVRYFSQHRHPSFSMNGIVCFWVSRDIMLQQMATSVYMTPHLQQFIKTETIDSSRR